MLIIDNTECSAFVKSCVICFFKMVVQNITIYKWQFVPSTAVSVSV